MWSKLVRLNALACTTSAYDKLLGEIRSTPELRAALVGAIEEGCAVGQAEGATDVDPAKALGELEQAHATLGSSMQRDIAAGREPELDAIPGSVLRAAARHGIECPTIERLVGLIAARARVPVPVVRALTDYAPKGISPGETPGAPAGTAWVATASTTSSSASVLPSSCSPSQSTRKFPVTPLSAWIVMPGRISSPSSSPRRSRSKCARPMPLAVCVGFSRSCAATAWAKRSRFFAIFPVVSVISSGRVARALYIGKRWPAPSQSTRRRVDPALDTEDGGDRREVIRTVALTKVYPGMDVAAVDKLDLSVHAGEIFGLLGPNGAGKTTTAGMLTTRVIPTSGAAYVGAVDVVAHPALAKQLIGIVSQQNTLDRQLTVWENLYFHGRLFGISASESRRKADELLEQLHLTKWAKASVYALSGGMAQRLMMARAIFHRPAVLFLDEPTAGLDPQSRLALWEILGELNGAGQTILLTTHYMEEADELCDRLAIMDHGKILALDTPADLKRSVGADTIATIKATGGELQTLAERLSGAIAEVSNTRVIDGGVELHVKEAERLVPRLVGATEEAGFELADLSIAEPSLETVFISLTGKELRD